MAWMVDVFQYLPREFGVATRNVYVNVVDSDSGELYSIDELVKTVAILVYSVGVEDDGELLLIMNDDYIVERVLMSDMLKRNLYIEEYDDDVLSIIEQSIDIEEIVEKATGGEYRYIDYSGVYPEMEIDQYTADDVEMALDSMLVGLSLEEAVKRLERIGKEGYIIDDTVKPVITVEVEMERKEGSIEYIE